MSVEVIWIIIGGFACFGSILGIYWLRWWQTIVKGWLRKGE
jgi:hypothetical protein